MRINLIFCAVVMDSSYKNDVFEEIESIEASAYRSKSTYNKFEELIQWTLDGKLWQYPINNEQGKRQVYFNCFSYPLGWVEEISTPFHEHVFLSRFVNMKNDKSTAPLKAFMDLVCAGLGKNPYISAKEKKDHLAWFEGYFATKVKDIEAAVEEERRIKEAELAAERGRASHTVQPPSEQ